MRLRAGDQVVVFDGRGNEALARVEAIAGQHVTVKTIEKRPPADESAIAITLAQALLKSEKMDRVIRDAVMLGVAAIRPFICERSEVPRAALGRGGRQERWARTVIASAKQCGRAVLPPVLPAVDFRELLSAERDAMCLMFVEPGSGPPAGSHIDGLRDLETRVPAKATVLVGPEGGWNPDEVKDAVAAGVTLVTLGRRTLRADAAGAVAIAVLRYVWKDF